MNTEIAILYEDEHLLAIDKPAGLMVHADGKRPTETLVDWFIDRYPEAADVGEDPIETQAGEMIVRPGIVHRLDRDTSGVMLLAKTNQGHAHLKAQFQERTVNKTYQALVYGQMKQDQYSVDAAIGRSKTFGRWTAIPKSIRGTSREAYTDIVVLARIDQAEGYSLIEARPKTGRTHQIRVHMQYLNHPIVADVLYAGKRNTAENNLGFGRQALHASWIEFENTDGVRVGVHSELPSDFQITD